MGALDALAMFFFPQLLEQYAEQVSWQSEIRHEAIRFPPMDKMIVDYQVRRGASVTPETANGNEGVVSRLVWCT